MFNFNEIKPTDNIICQISLKHKRLKDYIYWIQRYSVSRKNFITQSTIINGWDVISWIPIVMESDDPENIYTLEYRKDTHHLLDLLDLNDELLEKCFNQWGSDDNYRKLVSNY